MILCLLIRQEAEMMKTIKGDAMLAENLKEILKAAKERMLSDD